MSGAAGPWRGCGHPNLVKTPQLVAVSWEQMYPGCAGMGVLPVPLMGSSTRCPQGSLLPSSIPPCVPCRSWCSSCPSQVPLEQSRHLEGSVVAPCLCYLARTLLSLDCTGSALVLVPLPTLPAWHTARKNGSQKAPVTRYKLLFPTFACQCHFVSAVVRTRTRPYSAAAVPVPGRSLTDGSGSLADPPGAPVPSTEHRPQYLSHAEAQLRDVASLHSLAYFR